MLISRKLHRIVELTIGAQLFFSNGFKYRAAGLEPDLR